MIKEKILKFIVVTKMQIRMIKGKILITKFMIFKINI